MRKIFLTLLFICATAFCSYSFPIESVRFHCENDTTKINRLLTEAISADLRTPNEYMSFFADKLLGTTYVAHTLEGEQEYLTINIDELDCTTFVETLIALTKAAMSKSPTWYAYAAKLENIRYRGGQLDGYSSRLHYISAWIVENTSRGNFHEETAYIPHAESIVKSLNYMTSHRNSYPALSDSTEFAAIKQFETGYNMHMYPYINKRDLKRKDVIENLRDGDIICLTTKTEGLDVSHLGIVRFVKGAPHLLHASSVEKKVIIDKYDLFEMLRTLRSNTGIRVLRVDTSY